MRALKRNKQKFWYALYDSETELTDDDGNYTGEIGPSYEDPVLMKANISASKGSTGFELFGSDLQYSKTIVTDEMDCPITEETALWIGMSPFSEEDCVAGAAVAGITVCGRHDGSKHNYIVRGIAKSLNSIVYAIAEADRS